MTGEVWGRVGAIVAVALVACSIGTSVVQACALDNVPSMSMNGKLAARNNKMPGNLSIYAAFYFKRPIKAGHKVTMAENRRECARSLVASAMRHAARWRFGDGTTAYGWNVHHTYRAKGTYRITVSAYYAKGHEWYRFDEVDVVVRRA